MNKLEEVKASFRAINRMTWGVEDSKLIPSEKLLKIKNKAFEIFLGLHRSLADVKTRKPKNDEFIMVLSEHPTCEAIKVRCLIKEIQEKLKLIPEKTEDVPQSFLPELKRQTKNIFYLCGGNKEELNERVCSERFQRGFEFV
ncbi:hypothetical protein N9Y92_00700 [Chlamydiales bacterium]|nr:hypothetical protein [Chlamydiales bacterium]